MGRVSQVRDLTPNFTVLNLKMWAYCCKKTPKFVIFGINFPKRGIKRFLQNLAWGSESQVCTIMPNFTVVAVKMWATAPKIAKKKIIFGINLPLMENSGGPQKKLNIGAQQETFLYATLP